MKKTIVAAPFVLALALSLSACGPGAAGGNTADLNAAVLNEEGTLDANADTALTVDEGTTDNSAFGTDAAGNEAALANGY